MPKSPPTPSTLPSASACSDAALVAACLRGDKTAFLQLVRRHQALVCAIAYHGTGDFAASEDVAQETFVAAWKKLSELREPQKLKGWLSRIATTLAADWRRKHGITLDSGTLPDSADPADPPDAAAVSKEEAAAVWQALSALPETTRLPLILFYREGNSIASVAAALDLTEDAVKQRLSRGREALRERLAGLAEGVLRRTQPGAVFAFSVLGAIGVLQPPSAVAAAALGTAGKAATTSTTASTVAMTATQLSIAAAAALLLPIAWPSTASQVPKKAHSALLGQKTAMEANLAENGSKPEKTVSKAKTTDPRLLRLAVLMDAALDINRAEPAVLQWLEAEHLIHSLPQELLPSVLELMLARRTPGTQVPFANHLFIRWAHLDPHAAYAVAMNIPPGPGEEEEKIPLLRGQALGGVATAWTQRDHHAAFAFFQQIEDPDIRFNCIMQFGRTLALVAPEEAAVWWKKDPTRDSNLVSQQESLIRWSRHDPKAAWEWAKKQPQDDPTMTKHRDFLYQLLYSHPAEVIHFAREMPNGEKDDARAGLIWNALDQLTKQDPALAVNTLLTLAPADLGSTTLERMAEHVAQGDPVRLADALPLWENLDQREEIIAAVAVPLSRKDAARARALAEKIRDVEKRTALLKKLP